MVESFNCKQFETFPTYFQWKTSNLIVLLTLQELHVFTIKVSFVNCLFSETIVDWNVIINKFNLNNEYLCMNDVKKFESRNLLEN